MSPPVHAQQRKTVSPIGASENNLAGLEGLIRSRVQKILDGLPRNRFQFERPAGSGQYRYYRSLGQRI